MFPIYPYLNINDLNLDYLLKQIGILKTEVTQFVSLNAIKYADPIQWNITSQYEKNTVVIDPLTGTAYISVAPVPSGVALTNTDYWTVVFDLGSFVTRAAQNFTSRWESETTNTATFPTATGEWLIWGDVLYKALVNITAGDQYVVNSNIEHFTIEDLYNAYLNTVAQILAIVGDLADLTTSDTSSIVNAINSVVTDIADVKTIADANAATLAIISPLAMANELSIDNGKFIFGVFSDAPYYVNGLASDGQYFYYYLTPTDSSPCYIVKYDKYGVEMARLQLQNGHAANFTYYNGYVYAYGENDILKIPTNLSGYTVINIDLPFISIDNSKYYSYDHIGGVVHEYSDEFATEIASYPIDKPLFSTVQSVAVIDNLIYISGNYPNTIYVYDFVNGRLVKNINIDGEIDGVRFGEVQGCFIERTATDINIFVTGSKTVPDISKYYLPLFIMAGNFNEYEQKSNVVNSQYGVQYYVDGTSSANESLGTQAKPFKSLLECAMHLNYPTNSYRVIVVHVNSTVDNVALFRAPAYGRHLEITYQNDAPVANFRWCGAYVLIEDNVTTTHEIALQDCTGEILGSHSNLTVTNYRSILNVHGNSIRSYNVNGITKADTIGQEIANAQGFTVGADIEKVVASVNDNIVAGKTLKYSETMLLTIPANTTKTFRITSPYFLNGILSFMAESPTFIRSYMLTSYGTGGAARSSYNLLTGHNDDGAFSVAPVSGEPAFDVTITGVSSDIVIRATFTMLNYTMLDIRPDAYVQMSLS